jgi:hypothetical protein
MLEILALAALFGGAAPPPKRKGTPPMLKLFNAFQIVTLFAALPYIIGWLYTAPFPFSIAALATAVVVYVILFGWNVFAMSESFGD